MTPPDASATPNEPHTGPARGAPDGVAPSAAGEPAGVAAVAAPAQSPPTSGPPTSGPPTYGSPASGLPASGLPTYGAPGPGPGAAGHPWSPAAPVPRPPSPLVLASRAFWAAGETPAPAWTLGVAAAIGVLGGVLLVAEQTPGVGAALVGVAVWAAAVPALVRRRAWNALVTAGLAAALVAVLALLSAGWVVVLCLAVAVVAGSVAATSARSAPAVVLSPVSWAAGALRALPWVRHGIGALTGSRRDQLLVALRSVAVTLVLLIAFGALFASADSVFASYLPRLDVGMLPARVVIGAFVALVTASLAHLAAEPPGWSDHRMTQWRAARRGEWLLPVGSLAVLVVAFVLVQVGALVDGHRHVLRTLGLSYAEYARQGFAQLVVVTALTLVVVGVAARRAPRATAQDRLVSRVALGVLCVATLGVVASALRRMDLYVDAFGLTRPRLLVVVVEVVLAVVLVLVMIAGIRWRGTWLPVAVVQVVAVAMLGLALSNPDAQIVRHNTTREAIERLDVDYLRGLSSDAVPALDALDEPLRTCTLADRDVPAPQGLVEANLSRARAARILAEHVASGTADDLRGCARTVAGR